MEYRPFDAAFGTGQHVERAVDSHLFSGAHTSIAASKVALRRQRPSNRAFFGLEATRVAGRIPGDVAILACEPAFARSAMSEAIELRRAGQHFSISVHVEDVRDRMIRERSAQLCATYETWDEVRLMLDAFSETIAGQRTLLADADRELLFETLRLSDSVIVRSWSEHGRLVDAAGVVRRDVDIVINPDPTVPCAVAGARTDVVVYAPLYRADELAAFVSALGDIEVPVTIVARDRPTIAGRICFEPPERAAEALGRARVIIDANGNDPGVALALAELGRPLVVSSGGGGIEILRGARTYDLWNRRSILSAAMNGLSADPPQTYPGRLADRPPRRLRPAPRADTPLVSVIVATFNRRELLAETLAAIEAQTYPALEIIVVNDGGSDVGDVVARFPRARLIDQRENRGPAAARNRGLAEARGPLAIFFDDDDEMFPDHIAALANALDRSGLDVAYGQLMNCCTPSSADERTVGVSFIGHTALLDHADVQWAGALAPTAIMFRRALVEAVGTLDESLSTAEDYDFWLRLAAGREWARVSEVTSIYFIRNGGDGYSAKNGAQRYLDAHRAIYAKHRTLRPLVQAGRDSMLEYFGSATLPSPP